MTAVGGRVLVGREREIATARAVLDRAMSGDGQLLLIGGDPGIGKSRLAEELAGEAVDRGALVAWGRCWEAGGAPPYWPWTEAFNALVRHVGSDAAHTALADAAADVAVLAPALAGARSDAPPPEDAGARFRLYEGVMELLRVVAEFAGAAVVVVLEDVHVADPSSLLLLEFVASRLGGHRVLLVVTYRHGELTDDQAFTATLGELMRCRATTRVLLHGLDEAAVADLIADTTGRAPKALVARQVREQTDGNPLYVGEVARLLAAEGRLDAGTGASLIPRDVRSTVLQRVARLPAETREVLDAAAVLGREFPVDMLVAITSPEVLDQLEPAAASQLLAPAPNAIGRLRFSHAVVAQAVYEAMSPTQRMQLHLAAAEALEQRHGRDLDAVLAALALHYSAAVPLAEVGKAVDYARRAGDRAVRQLAYEEAARLYVLALSAQASGAASDTGARIDLMLAIGDAYARAGDRDASKGAFLEAADLARSDGDVERLGRAALGYSGRFVWLRPGGDTRLVPLLEEALALLPHGSLLWTRIAARLAGALRDEWDGTRRRQLSAEALEAARAIDDAETLAMVQIARFAAVQAPDTVTSDELIALVAAAERSAAASGNPERESEVRYLRLVSRIAISDVAGARREAERYEEHATRLRQPSQQWYAAVLQTIVRLMDGPLDGVDALVDEAHRLGQFAQPWDAAASHRMATALLRREQGCLSTFEPELRAALVEFPHYRLFAAYLALCLVELGRADEALELSRVLAGPGPDGMAFDNSWLFAMQVLAEVACETQDHELGALLHERLLPYADLVGQAAGEVAIGSVSHHLSRLDALAGRLDDAARRFELALAAHRAADASVWVANTLYHYAVVLERRAGTGDAARAAGMFAEAGDLADRLGIGSITARLEERRSVTRTQATRLTPREEDVARLVARGLSNREIAAELYVSERTAETHVQHILTKLGFGSRTQIATWAVRTGLEEVAATTSVPERPT